MFNDTSSHYKTVKNTLPANPFNGNIMNIILMNIDWGFVLWSWQADTIAITVCLNTTRRTGNAFKLINL